MKVHKLLHSSQIVEDLARTRAFYEGVLGLVPSTARPDMSFDGVWYELGLQQIHLLCLPNPRRAWSVHSMAAATGTWRLGSTASTNWRGGWMRPAFPTPAACRAGRSCFAENPDDNALEFVEIRAAGQ